ncbi:mgtA regulatory leader peptide MgtL [Klebsiella pasteurii]|nr:mgtA regulatory leader peptide MgtL [Klebsiella sp. CTHL.F3a]
MDPEPTPDPRWSHLFFR